MPGEPMGMPGTLRPMALGLSRSRRFTSSRGHMAFQRVARNAAGVAGPELAGHAPALAGVGVAAVVGLDGKAIGFEVGDPVFAAAAAGVFPDFDQGLGSRGPGGEGQGDAGTGQSGEKVSSFAWCSP
jgi:hypothetical protein